jgi:hypothetical protein
MWDACTMLPAPPRCHLDLPVFIGLDGSTKRDSITIVLLNGDGNSVRLVSHKIFVPSPGKPVHLELVRLIGSVDLPHMAASVCALRTPLLSSNW